MTLNTYIKNISKMFRKETPARIALKTRKGFALVLALALMGFMVLLVVTLATMVQMQLRLSRQSLNDYKAKQAAKFAAYQAMGQIQSALGPDRRITANAMMFDDTLASDVQREESEAKGSYEWWSSPIQLTRAEVAQIDHQELSRNRYWVGVWDSSIGRTPDRIKPKQERMSDSDRSYGKATINKAVTWLVSGNGIKAPDEATNSSTVKYRPYDKLEAGKYVRAVKSGSYTDGNGAAVEEEDVRAPLVTLDVDPNPVTGDVNAQGKETRIAWWVSDEGQKASLNAVASREFLKHAEKIEYRTQSMPCYSGIHALTMPDLGGGDGVEAFNLDFQDSDDDSSSMAKIRNLDDIAQLDIIKSEALPENSSPSKAFFHSVTFNTKGVICNVRQGGLKKDLSIGLVKINGENEKVTLSNELNNYTDDSPEYYRRPYGVGGYDFKTTAYPLINKTEIKKRQRREPPQNSKRMLKGSGHIFGPQLIGHENMEESGVGGYYEASAIANVSELYSDTYIWKDPGGPLWDQLRSYYNLRTDDSYESANTPHARVQTDDRIGLKPVVKRFQVFYIPSFVKYGTGGRHEYYGLRLHIMPVMVLYNPYDVKIPGDTYYAIVMEANVRGLGFPSPLGVFRFAIGIKQNNRFQCLRDLRTEVTPFYDTTNPITIPSQYQNEYYVTLRKGGLPFDWFHSEAERHFTRYETARKPWLSQRTGFYTNFSANHNEGITTRLPIGYGIQAPNYLQPSNPGNDKTHWKDIIANDNLVPTIEDTINWKKQGDKNSRWAGRVARIPLFLNNIVMELHHGSLMDEKTDGNGYRWLVPQRQLDALKPREVKWFGQDWDTNRRGIWGQTANMHFLAYDSKGIEAGKAAIFVMKNIVNYLGSSYITNDINSTPGEYGRNSKRGGPNGILEKYTYKNNYSCMVQLSEAGQMGGCFYVDVPHPEGEHQIRYNTNGMPRYTSNKNYDNVMFDLRAIRALGNINGINVSGLTIDDCYIDMQDMALYCDISSLGDGNYFQANNVTPYCAQINSTPLGYGVLAFNADYITQWSNNSYLGGYSGQTVARKNEYNPFALIVWIWKREGFDFKDLNEAGDDFGGWEIRKSAVLCYMRGLRTFFGPYQNSFPNPSLIANVGNEIFNYHYAGYVSDSTSGNRLWLWARSSQGNPSQLGGSNGYDDFDAADGWTGSRTDAAAEYPKRNIPAGTLITEEYYGNNNFRSKYYINWLGINPRRHSMNSWRVDAPNATKRTERAVYNIMFNDNHFGDAAPEAIRGTLNGNVPQYNQEDYRNALNSAIETTEGRIPYSLVFSIPGADPGVGSQPFFNRRLFVNNNVVATAFEHDYSAREISGYKEADTGSLMSDLASINKSIQGCSLVYSKGDNEGVKNMGYDLKSPDDAHVEVGFRSDGTGTITAPIHHILRKTEVVSNPANLASAHLTFGVGIYDIGTSTQTADKRELERWDRSYGLGIPDSLYPEFAIGNSLCPSRIIPERSYYVPWIDGEERADAGSKYANWKKGEFNNTREDKEERGVIYDMSWHLNDALWDEYFFSTLPYRNDEKQNTLDVSVAYPQNPRIQYYVSSDDYISLSDMDNKESDEPFEQNAAKFWINGPFNVNSTSVDAWKAVLSTYYEQPITGYDGDTRTYSGTTSFVRWGAPFSANDFTSNSSANDEDNVFKGFRTLTRAEIEELALSIVEHIKDRGPFYSMSDFVNRAVSNKSAEVRYSDQYAGDGLLPVESDGSDHRIATMREELNDNGDKLKITHMQKGVLQAAIDATSINRPFHQDNELIIRKGTDGRNMSDFLSEDDRWSRFRDPEKVWENWRAAIGPQATGAPTYLMQQDILARIGSFLTVRSDTFKIRAYGEVRNPISGIVEGKAWCEMVVQRVPDYIDNESQGQDPWACEGRELEIGFQGTIRDNRNFNKFVTEDDTDGLNPVNKTLGRRFKVVSFRWLNEREI